MKDTFEEFVWPRVLEECAELNRHKREGLRRRKKFFCEVWFWLVYLAFGIVTIPITFMIVMSLYLDTENDMTLFECLKDTFGDMKSRQFNSGCKR